MRSRNPHVARRIVTLLIGALAALSAGRACAEPVLQAHPVPAERRGDVDAWRRELPANIRAVWDERTGQLLLMAPLETHGELMQLIAGAKEKSEPKRSSPSGLALRHLTPEQLHERLQQMARRPLPATWDAARTTLSFPASLEGGAGVDFRINAATGAVAIDGPAEAANAWRDVVVAIEQAIAESKSRGANGGQVRAVSTGSAPRERVRTALKAMQVAAPSEPGATPPVAQPEAGIATDDSILGPVQIEFVDGLDVVVVNGDQEDVARVMRIIDQIEQLSADTIPAIEVRRLRHLDADSLARLLQNVYSEALGPRVGDLSVTGLAKPNALLLIGREENVNLALSLVDRLDQPVEPQSRFEVYPLQHASAGDVKTLVDDYFEQQNSAGGDDATSLLRSRAFVVADYRSNSLIVSAAPRDQIEVKALINRLDGARGAAVDEVRVFPLRNALAADLAEVLSGAISPEAAVEDDSATPRAAALRLGSAADALESGVLTGVRVAPDTRANALVVTAPAGSMDLIGALISRLDQAPNAEAELKVFAVANGDAAALADMVRSLFGSEDDEEGTGFGSAGLTPLTVTVDPRTNSLIAAGTKDDLAVVEAILLRLDDAEVGGRQTTVFRLKNAEAANVATVLNEWLDNQREAEDQADLAFSPSERIDREVVIVAETATNSLIVSATPRYEAELRQLVEQLDDRPPMVMIQVMIAEVTLNDTDEFGVELGLQDSLLFDRSLLSNIETIQTTVNDISAGGATTTTTSDTVISSDLTPGFNFNNQPLGNNGSDQVLAQAGNVAAQALSSFALGRVNGDLDFGGFVLGASSSNVSFLLRALQENRRLEVLSRPQIMTLDGQLGRVQVGSRVDRIRSATPNQFGGQTISIEPEDIGIILEVTPRITPDGQVVMNVFAEKSELGPEAEGTPVSFAATGEVIRSPQINTTRAETTISAASGQTAVVSGLLTKRTFDVHRRVPLLADVPLLGDLFRYDAVQEARTELLIILTPRVVRNELDAEMLKQVESSRMSWVLSDVVDLHGPSGLRTRGDHWQEAEACYPTHVPTEVEIVPPALGATEETRPLAQPEANRPLSPPPVDPRSVNRVEAATYAAPAPRPRLLPSPSE